MGPPPCMHGISPLRRRSLRPWAPAVHPPGAGRRKQPAAAVAAWAVAPADRRVRGAAPAAAGMRDQGAGRRSPRQAAAVAWAAVGRRQAQGAGLRSRRAAAAAERTRGEGLHRAAGKARRGAQRGARLLHCRRIAAVAAVALGRGMTLCTAASEGGWTLAGDTVRIARAAHIEAGAARIGAGTPLRGGRGARVKSKEELVYMGTGNAVK